MTDYTDALVGVTQEALNDCDASFSASGRAIYAYLKVGAMHGVTVAVERRTDSNGQIPGLVRNGVVMRFLIPLGAHLEDLDAELAEGGTLAALLDRLLAGHVLSLRAKSATGCLTEAAKAARDALLDETTALGSSWHTARNINLADDHACGRASKLRPAIPPPRSRGRRIRQEPAPDRLQRGIRLVDQGLAGRQFELRDVGVRHVAEVLHQPAQAVAVGRHQHRLARRKRRRDLLPPVAAPAPPCPSGSRPRGNIRPGTVP